MSAMLLMHIPLLVNNKSQRRPKQWCDCYYNISLVIMKGILKPMSIFQKKKKKEEVRIQETASWSINSIYWAYAQLNK